MPEFTGTLLIDTREKDADIIANVERVAEELGIESEHVQLEHGDYVYENDEKSVAIEYKSIGDAAQSTTGSSPRLVKQANRLAENFDAAYVVIVGGINDMGSDYYSSMSYAARYAQMVEKLPIIMSETNIPISMIEKDNAFADIFIRVIVHKGEGSTLDTVMISPGVSEDDRMAVLMGISDIGRGTVKKILDKFGTLQNVAQAQYDELLEVNGVGERTAWKIYVAFRSEWTGEPGFNYEGTGEVQRIRSFLDTHGVGDSILLDVYGGTDELTDDVSEYVEQNYSNISDAKKEKIIDAARN